MKPLDKIKEILDTLKEDTITPKEIERFLLLVLGTIKKEKESFQNITKEQADKIDESVALIENKANEVTEIIADKLNTTKIDFNNELNSVRELLQTVREIKATPGKDGKNGKDGMNGKDGIDGINGIDGKDGVDGQNGLPGADGSPDTRLQIVEKINTGKKEDVKIDVKQVKGMEELAQTNFDRAIGILDQRTQFLINKNTSSGGTWGTITGTLSDQTDLQSALDAKQEDALGTGFTAGGGSGVIPDETIATLRDFKLTTSLDATYNPSAYTNNFTFNGAYDIAGSFFSAPGYFSLTNSNPAQPVWCQLYGSQEESVLQLQGNRPADSYSSFFGADGYTLKIYAKAAGAGVDFTFDETQATFIDTRALTVGIQYSNDYSADFTARSLVDKAYVDGSITNYSFSTGLTNTANTITANISTGKAGSQTIYGGTAANEDLTIEGTTNATKTTSYVNLQTTGGLVGIGTTTPRVKLDVIDNSGNAQLRLSYTNNTQFANFYTLSNGNIFIENTGTSILYGVGAPEATEVLSLGGTFTGSGTNYGFNLRFNYEPASDTSSAQYGIQYKTSFKGSSMMGNAASFLARSTVTNTNSSSTITGMSGFMESTGTAAGLNWIGIRTYLDHASSGTITNWYGLRIDGVVTNSGTITNTYGIYIDDVTMGTQTNTPYSFYASDVNARNYFAGKTGIEVTAPTAMLHLKAGTATANTAPLKFNSGTNLTTAETGAMEYDGTNLYFTPTGTTRHTIPYLGLAQTFTADQTFSGKVIAQNVVRLKGYTVATLPAGTVGDTAYVTDATAPTYNGALTGGGAVVVPVFYNGTAWVSA